LHHVTLLYDAGTCRGKCFTTPHTQHEVLLPTFRHGMYKWKWGHAEQLPGVLCKVFNHEHLWGIWHQRPCAQSIWSGHWLERHLCKAGQGFRVYETITLTIPLLSPNYTLDYTCHARQEIVVLAWTVCAVNSLLTEPRLSFLVCN